MDNKNHAPTDDDSLQILQKIEDMVVYAYPLVSKWSVRDMHAIGNRMNECMLDMLEYATAIRWRIHKKTDITALDTRNHQLQTLIKTAYKTKVLKGLSSYKEWTRRSEEIGRMIGGFIKSATDEKSVKGNTANPKQRSSSYGSSRYRR
jgi:hypothetical protein